MHNDVLNAHETLWDNFWIKYEDRKHELVICDGKTKDEADKIASDEFIDIFNNMLKLCTYDN